MFNVDFNEITEEHLKNLIEERFQENSSVDYKKELPGNDDKSKIEFLADVSAFANYQGGYIFYGIEENEGLPIRFNPLKIDQDKICLQLQDKILNNLDPKLSGYKIRAVPIADEGYVVVINIPQSWSRPHRVKLNNHFYIREGARKRQLEIPEIRMAFLNSDLPNKKISEFRAERISKIISEETPIKIADGLIQIFHVLPLSSVLNNTTVNILNTIDYSRIPIVSLGLLGISWKINIDGVVTHRPIVNGKTGAYTQIFRNGFIEAVRVFQKNPDSNKIIFPSTQYEKELIEFMRRIKETHNTLGIEGPFVILYSLLNAKNIEFGVTYQHFLDEGKGFFDREQIMLPDLLIQEPNLDEGMMLRPLFDLIWNAAGFEQSLNYDNRTGIWCNPNSKF